MRRLLPSRRGRRLLRHLGGRAHTKHAYKAAFSPDGKRIVSGGEDDAVRVWDARSGKELRKYPGHGPTVNDVAFFPDGKRITATSWDGPARVWRAALNLVREELTPRDARPPGGRARGPGGVRRPAGWYGNCPFLPCRPRCPEEEAAVNTLTPPAETPFHGNRLWSTPIRDLGLKIEGTPLEPVIDEFRRELEAAGFRKLKPHFYLSTDWGVNENTIAIGIPFYLARRDLIELHAEQDGHLEGVGRAALLRYLRHEMGHVVNYAYQLYESEEWVRLFGSMTQPYLDEYRPEPFSRRFVLHLPGWYAQKHPDEDWAETFAVWMTPAANWRSRYADWPEALKKLEYCDRLMQQLGDQEPAVTALDRDWDVADLDYSVAEHYREWNLGIDAVNLPGLDGALLAIFEDLGEPEDQTTHAERLPAADLIRKWERTIQADVFRWTGHFPERTRALLRHLAERAVALRQVYPADRESQALLGLSTLVTALAMNHVHHGTYLPEK